MSTLQGLLLTLRLCIPSKYEYLLRSLRLEHHRHHVKTVDSIVLNTALNLTGLRLPYDEEMSKISRTLIALPFLKGGNGIRSLRQIAPAASLGSWAVVAPRVFNDFLLPLYNDQARYAHRTIKDQWQSLEQHKYIQEQDVHGLLRINPKMAEDIRHSIACFYDKLTDVDPPPGFEPVITDCGYQSYPPNHPAAWTNSFCALGFLLGSTMVYRPNSPTDPPTMSTTYSDKLQRTLSELIHNDNTASLMKSPYITPKQHVVLNSCRNPCAAGLASASPSDPDAALSNWTTRVLFATRSLLNPIEPINPGQDIFQCKGPGCQQTHSLNGPDCHSCTAHTIVGKKQTGHKILQNAVSKLFKHRTLAGTFSDSIRGNALMGYQGQ